MKLGFCLSCGRIIMWINEQFCNKECKMNHTLLNADKRTA